MTHTEIIKIMEKMHDFKIALIITAFKEPKTIGKAIEAALNQKTNYSYEIFAAATAVDWGFPRDLSVDREQHRNEVHIFWFVGYERRRVR